MSLSLFAYKKIDQEISKYPKGRKSSAVMAALAIAQDEKGWLSTDLLEEVAVYLEMAPIAVLEVASFYTMYNLKPVGKYQLTICTNLPCMLGGSWDSAKHLKSKLGIAYGQTTSDKLFSLKEGECMGACGDAPVLLVNNKRMCTRMYPEKIDLLLKDLNDCVA